MFNISGGEFIIILVVVLLVIEPKKLPQFVHIIGKTIRFLKQKIGELTNILESEPLEDFKKKTADFFKTTGTSKESSEIKTKTNND